MTTEEFQIERRSGIGGSDIAALFGMHPFKTIHDVYMEKVGLADPRKSDERMEAGMRLEPVILEWYANKNHLTLERPGFLRHPQFDFIIGHPDALAQCNGDKVVVEAKNVDGQYRYAWGDPETDQVPDAYNFQVQHYMAVTGLKLAHCPVLIGGNDFRIYHVPCHEGLITAILGEARHFWQTYVVPCIPPAIDGSESAKTLLSKLYPKDSGETMLADAELNDFVGEYLTLTDDLVATEEKKRKLENQIKKRMGAASLLSGPGYRISWKTTKERQTIDYKKVLLEAQIPPDLLAKHTKMEPGIRPFRPTRIKGE